MNEKTEAAPSKGLEEAPADSRLLAHIEETERPIWRLEELRDADLRDQDLTKIKGLLPEHLAGADLTGAKLPDEIAKFPALAQVAAISSEARKIFIGLLAACVYSWLVIGTTKDVSLILNTASSPLPIINTPIPIAGFYVVGAALLAAVYCYLHFYLHSLWRVLATLPAFFPDGVALDDKSDPWLLNNLVRIYFERLKPHRHPLKRLETSLSIALAWVLVPFTLFALWARYLPSHDGIGMYWLVILTWFTTLWGWHFFRFARAALSGEAPPSNGPGIRGTWRELRALSWAGRTFWFVAVIVTSLMLPWYSYAAFHVNPRDDRSWAARGLIALRLLGIRTYADLREVDVAVRPEIWYGDEWSGVKRVDLRGRNLAFADATRAFLTNTDLRGANLTGAILAEAELQGADLYDDDTRRGARLQGADLRQARLYQAEFRGADLSSAQLQGADLRDAQLQNAGLEFAQLQGANLWGAQLQGADLSHAQLQGADLKFAQLQGADLKFAQLQAADLRQTTISPARADGAQWDLADLRGSTAQPMSDSENATRISEVTERLPDEGKRNAAAERLNDELRTERRPPRLDFPDKRRLKPNVMFEPGDPAPRAFDWGPRKWATEQAYDEDLAKLLGELACGRDVAEAQTRGLARRALEPERLRGGTPDRIWPRLFAARVIGADCLPAEGLPGDMRRRLEELAAQGDAAVVPPRASAPDPVQ